eukprot:scaffold110523_cov54-Phaeocystis_antarctica.AAC.2
MARLRLPSASSLCINHLDHLAPRRDMRHARRCGRAHVGGVGSRRRSDMHPHRSMVAHLCAGRVVDLSSTQVGYLQTGC